MKLEDSKKRIDQLIILADAVSATERHRPAQRSGSVVLSGGVWVDGEQFQEFRSASLSFIDRVFDSENVFYKEFDAKVTRAEPSDVRKGRGILRAIKQEIDGGWLATVRGLVSAEIFTDFLEMAGHLLQEGFKDPAAVIIGGVLEEHLRQLCTKNGMDPTYQKDGKDLPKTADRMNNELAGAGAYNKLYQKNVTGWLDLRNKAAHGQYKEYDVRQVELMEAGVADFMAKT